MKISKTELQNKIKGGWAAQTIGCSYGGETEFGWKGKMIPDNYAIPWNDSIMYRLFTTKGGLYDDVYMDLIFVDMFEKHGFDVSAKELGNAFAHADFLLWHANQLARYNILRGINPPESGNWMNNPHADCIDYQIESDFAGLMSPGMPETSCRISDKVGHIMNSGDGYYGGVFVGVLYSLAFTNNDIHYIIKEALKAIPEKSSFHRCINDVVDFYEKNPSDWKAAWKMLDEKWDNDMACSEGLYDDFNIDAKLNSAYCMIGLLYGNGDFGKTMEFATRCGQDSDCNPATAAGILGVILGYDAIPDKFLKPCKLVENKNFDGVDMSLNKVYQIGYKHALAMIKQNGGTVEKDVVVIKVQPVKTVPYEQNFEGMRLAGKIAGQKITSGYTFDFEGNGFLIMGNGETANEKLRNDFVVQFELSVDNNAPEIMAFPLNYKFKLHRELAWKYLLPEGKHQVKLEWKNPNKEVTIDCRGTAIYTTIK
ncbi:MAG: ADP-ribosylglycohydrolase family protein [Mariniphaga sp.]|nr:ADP-ribosylglycohydrolase family protein [Mariniphaga sp.]